MPDSPQDPITALAEGAAQLHELYEAHVHAGFTPDQALQIVLTIMAAGVRGAA